MHPSLQSQVIEEFCHDTFVCVADLEVCVQRNVVGLEYLAVVPWKLADVEFTRCESAIHHARDEENIAGI